MAFCKQSLRGVSRGDFTFQQPLVQRVLLPAHKNASFPGTSQPERAGSARTLRLRPYAAEKDLSRLSENYL